MCDFAGSGIEGLPSTVGAGVRYANPQLSQNIYSRAKDDMFALGTALYELESRKRLFGGRSSRDIYGHLRDQEYPELSMMSLRLVIEKCWNLLEHKASDAVAELGLSKQTAYC